jgi:hypothetical protein
MFRALLAHPQEALRKRHLYYACVMSVGCTRIEVPPGFKFHFNPGDVRHKQYTKCRCVAPPEDEQVTLETCTGPLFLIN